MLVSLIDERLCLLGMQLLRNSSKATPSYAVLLIVIPPTSNYLLEAPRLSSGDSLWAQARETLARTCSYTI